MVARGAATAAAVLAIVCCSLPLSASAAAPADVDRGFGRLGAVSVAPGPPSATAPFYWAGEDMVVGPNDEIYALVESALPCGQAPCADLMVQKLRPEGDLDTSFDGDGTSAPIRVPRGDGPRPSHALAVSPPGEAVVAFAAGGNVGLARLGTSGGLDPSFGENGIVTVDLGGDEAEPRLAVAADGRVVLALSSEGAGVRSLVVARFLRDGTLDRSFGDAGFAAVGRGSLGGLALAASGKVALGTPSCCSLTSAVRFGRLRADGGPDRAVSRSGWRRLSVGRAPSISTVIALRRGRVLLVGSLRAGAFAARLRPNGRLDPGYGRAGVVRMGALTLREQPPEAAVDGRGRLLVAGAAALEEPFSNEVLLLRRRADGRPDRAFGGGRAVDVPYYLAGPVALGVQAQGRIVLFAETGFCVRACINRAPILIAYAGGGSRARCLGARATVVGTRARDRLVGTPRRDVIAALGGADTVFGRGGDDLICGGADRDELFGGPGRDRVRP